MSLQLYLSRGSLWGDIMASLEINVPDDLHERLRRIAGAGDGAVSEFVMAAIRRELELLEWTEQWAKRPVREDIAGAAALEEAQSWGDKGAGKEPRELTMAEWQERRKNRPVLHINFDAAEAIREERQRREQEWDNYIESRRKSAS